MNSVENIRNLAIIAHVDHGKTTLVDSILKQTNLSNSVITERLMDNNDLEKERGITIMSKYLSVEWEGYRLNIMDTPGHGDFGGEVERVLNVVDGVILLVDSSEGPMAQTRFVLSKALARGFVPIVVINKMDRQDARYREVESELLDLFLALDATEAQFNFPVLYAVGRDGWANTEPVKNENIYPLLRTIVNHIPAPKIFPCKEKEGSFICSMLHYDKFLGKCFTGKVWSGILSKNQNVNIIGKDPNSKTSKILQIKRNSGLEYSSIDEACAGDIVTICGVNEATVNDTLAGGTWSERLPYVEIDPPTISVNISANTSPLTGQEGKLVNFREIRDYLFKEAENNVSIEVSENFQEQSVVLAGRGELQIGIILENMRRLGFEISVGFPKVLFKEEDGKKLEPMEELTIDVDTNYSGVVIEKITARKGILQDMKEFSDRTRLVFIVPSRCLFGYKQEFLSDTKGTGVMNKNFHGYEPYKGDWGGRKNGVLVASADGETNAYGLFNLESRGVFFLGTGQKVYEGMIVGESCISADLWVNVCKKKQLSNMRTAGKDENIILTPPRLLILETALAYINEDELVEVTPKSIRLRKKKLKK